MSNALIYHILSGQAFFSGITLIILAVLASFRPMGRRATTCRKAAARFGIFLVVISSTPLTVWFALIAGTTTIAWLWSERTSNDERRTLKLWLRSSILVVWTLGAAMELPYHMLPILPPMGHPPVYVVGDSISAGMGGESETWPKILSRRHAVEVHDLSMVGAGMTEALKQEADRVVGSKVLVLLEIGGNDLLGNTSFAQFARDLDALLKQLRQSGRTVVMLELPLPPFYHRYGSVQRRLARRHGVLLVPKRVLLGLLLSGGATLDSIHLSSSGHSRMANVMWSVIRGAFDQRNRSRNH